MRIALLTLGYASTLLGFGRSVTFYTDVVPILQRHCQSCHRPGRIAPMAFRTYAETRPWAKAIKAAVLSRKMPPWFADPRYGHFANDPSLTRDEVSDLVAWADTGAPEGDPASAPPAVAWPDGGWQIRPDVVVSLPAYRVPATGVLDWAYASIPSGFGKDTWVTSIEILPDDAAVLHHAALFFRPHHRANDRDDPLRGAGSIEALYVPGFGAMNYRVHHAAKLVPADSDLIVQMHYTPKGQEVTERIRIGFAIARQKPALQFVTYSPKIPTLRNRQVFCIPAGDSNWESPPVNATFKANAELVWFLPHMHLRGKDMTYALTYPDGRSEILLRVPKYNFEWQLGYDLAAPVTVLKGTKFRAYAHYDNSADNPFNPDPTQNVYGGTHTWEEMMVPFFGIVVDARVNPRHLVSFPGE
jgi:hypothetical protein